MLAESESSKQFGSEALWKSSLIENHIQQRSVSHLKKPRRTPGPKICFLGLETKPELFWEDWDEGREYTKSLTLKNMGVKLQKLQIRPPLTKFFSIHTYQNAAVSPGTTLSIPVAFRPKEKCNYEDRIEFQGKDSSFQVLLRAVVPSPALEVPETVLLPICAVHQSTCAIVQVKNLSKLHTYFYWECPEPFQVSPEEGVLKPHQEIELMVLFHPKHALFYRKHACCNFGEEGEKVDCCATVLLQGVAKYPCLQLRNPNSKVGTQHDGPVLNFGSVAVGQSLQKCFEVYNPSHVDACFSLARLPGGVPLLGSDFTCDVSSGNVASGCSVSAKVSFAPTVPDSASVEYLTVECRGALNKTVLKLIGNCAGPKLSFSSSVVDFGCVEVGARVSHTVNMVSSSSIHATYQWDLDCTGHSVFSIHPHCGTVPPKSSIMLTIIYHPTVPIAHYRSVPCLILHGEPLFLNLIGTCHSDLQKPAVLRPEHLWDTKDDQSDIFSVLLPSYSTQLDPQAFSVSVNEKASQRDSSSLRSITSKEDTDQPVPVEMDPPNSSQPCTRVSVTPSELLFIHMKSSFSSLSTPCPPSQGVAITNHAPIKVTLVWTNSSHSPFSISPSTRDLAPLKSTSFRVTYKPKKLNTLHAAQLECLAIKAQNQPSDNEEEMCTPWCVVVRVIGHSFENGKEHFYPHCSLEPNVVVFAGLSVRAYQTLLLSNVGEKPLTFCRNLSDCSDPASEATVSIVPRCGLVLPGEHQIFTVITTPKEDLPLDGIKLYLHLNFDKYTKEITVFSLLEKTKVLLMGGDSLYFQDTSVGSLSQQTYLIRNICRLPLGFRWNIRWSDQEIIAVDPEDGEMQANESATQTWTFTPMEEKTYTLEPILTFWPIQDPGCDKSILTLKIVGKGTKGSLEALKEFIDMGDTLVGRAQSVDVSLLNSSTCAISFTVSVEQTLQDEQFHRDHQSATIALQLDYERGTVAAHSTFMLRATFRPDRQSQYKWTINYQTLSLSGVPLSPLQAVCEVHGKGVFPTMQVTDVGSGGGAAWLSKTYVWELLSVDSLNAQLQSIPSPVEHMYRSPKEHCMHTYPTTLIKDMLDFNFSASPLNSETSTFGLVFYNPGSIPIEWTILFPDNQQVDFKQWSQGDEICHNELEQMQVVDLFAVSPLSGTLLSGQQMSIQLSYSHAVAGAHKLPIILKISHGREILLLFHGVTVESQRPHLYFLSTHHIFTPIRIGGLTPPVQTYDLYNGGDVPVHYEVDAGVLSRLQENNFNQPLLCCLNPVGVVLPGKTAKLEFIFSPLEAKMHRIDLPIHIRHGETTVVRFDACGLGTQTDVFPISQPKSVTCVRRIPLPGQYAFLSVDNILLGEIPVCSQTSRIFFLTNVSSKEIFFKWCLTQVIRIQPKQGLARPGESIFSVLTFTSTDYPAIYHLDIICQLTPQAAQVQYSEALQQWEQEREKQRNEFTITEKDLSESPKVCTDKILATVPQTKGPSLGKYKTLPPICSRIARAEQRAQNEAVKLRPRPTPPQPTVLHLELMARSYRSQEYLRYFPDNFNNHYRCFQSVKPLRPRMLSDTFLQDGRPSQKLGPERKFVEHVIASLLRSVLDDDAFTTSLLTMASKPLFYKPKVIFSAPAQIPQPLILLEETNTELHMHGDNLGMAGSSSTKLIMPSRVEHIPVGVFKDVLLNTIQNLMVEVVRRGWDPTELHSMSSPNLSSRSKKNTVAKVKKDDKEATQSTSTIADFETSPLEENPTQSC